MRIVNNKIKGFKNLKIKIMSDEGEIIYKYLIIEDKEEWKIVKYVSYMIHNKIENAIFKIHTNTCYFFKFEISDENENEIIVVFSEKQVSTDSDILLESENFFFSKSPTIINTNEVNIKDVVDLEDIIKKIIMIVIIVIFLGGGGMLGWNWYKKMSKPKKEEVKVQVPPLSPDETNTLKYFGFIDALKIIKKNMVDVSAQEGVFIQNITLTFTPSNDPPQIMYNIQFDKFFSYPVINSTRENDMGIFRKSESETVIKPRHSLYENGHNKINIFNGLPQCDIKMLFEYGFKLMQRGPEEIRYSFSSSDALNSIKYFFILSGLQYIENKNYQCKYLVNSFNIAGGRLNAEIIVYKNNKT